MDGTKLIKEDKIKLEILVKEDFNPWAVSDASVFLRYCCPECEFQSKGLITFGEHAITNHHRSSVLFKPEETELKSEVAPDNSDDEDYDPLLVEAKVKIDQSEESSMLPVVTTVIERPLSNAIDIEGDVFICKKCLLLTKIL